MLALTSLGFTVSVRILSLWRFEAGWALPSLVMGAPARSCNRVLRYGDALGLYGELEGDRFPEGWRSGLRDSRDEISSRYTWSRRLSLVCRCCLDSDGGTSWKFETYDLLASFTSLGDYNFFPELTFALWLTSLKRFPK